MQISPSAPLLALREAGSINDLLWHSAARNACQEAICGIDFLLQSDGAVDRDIRVCLDAVRNSLNWVLDEQASANQVRATITRAIQVFRKVEMIRA